MKKTLKIQLSQEMLIDTIKTSVLSNLMYDADSIETVDVTCYRSKTNGVPTLGANIIITFK